MFLIVLQAEGAQFGLVVDGVNDTEEIVVKPLGAEMKGLTVFAGAAIMGDGKVALILDILWLARRAALLNDEPQTSRDADDPKLVGGAPKEVQTLLIARAGGNRIGIPLSYVARLEEMPSERIERAGNTEVAQYRGRIMNVFRLGDVLGLRSGAYSSGAAADDSLKKMVVCKLETKNVGFIVDEIEDIVQEAMEVEQLRRQPRILGSAIIHQRVTDLIDVEYILGMVA